MVHHRAARAASAAAARELVAVVAARAAVVAMPARVVRAVLVLAGPVTGALLAVISVRKIRVGKLVSMSAV